MKASPRMTIERESMEYDVVIVGAGPAGLSAAIRLKCFGKRLGSWRSYIVGGGIGSLGS